MDSWLTIGLALAGFAVPVLGFWFKRRLDTHPEAERWMMRVALTVGVLLLVGALVTGVVAFRADSKVTADPSGSRSAGLTASPSDSPSPSPSVSEGGDDGPAPIRRDVYAWKATDAIDLDSSAANWGAKRGDWQDIRDVGWSYDGEIGTGATSGEVSAGVPITRSACEEAWTNREKALPKMRKGAHFQFCLFLAQGKVAMISVQDVRPPAGTSPAVATVEIAVWAN
ncbi:hypothetical protein HDA40_001290 [Hamadaea flava]|uniref:Uncharacterized protein n=1 Tax=Hamadaea flava TaxID=1742688 RepID=A0ABV8LQL2_9ACTN|nr:hypothetical protein [Hamadaea flava]MCP2322783.1 hypothetical protein [Hamadaea flava]